MLLLGKTFSMGSNSLENFQPKIRLRARKHKKDAPSIPMMIHPLQNLTITQNYYLSINTY